MNPSRSMQDHHSLAGRNQWNRELGMEKDVHALAHTGNRDQNLIPPELVPTAQQLLGHVWLVGEPAEISRIFVKEEILVASINRQQFLGDVTRVNADSTLFIQSAQHNPDFHCISSSIES